MFFTVSMVLSLAHIIRETHLLFITKQVKIQYLINYNMPSTAFLCLPLAHYIIICLVEAWFSLEQYIGLKEDKLSSTTVDFIRSEGNLETKHLYWFRKP